MMITESRSSERSFTREKKNFSKKQKSNKTQIEIEINNRWGWWMDRGNEPSKKNRIKSIDQSIK